MSGTIEKMNYWADLIGSDRMNIGYDQIKRFSFLDMSGRSVIPNTAGDCSAISLGIAYLAGFNVNLTGQANTDNAVQLLTAADFVAIPFSGRLSQIEQGDMLRGPGHMVYCRYSDLWLSAEQNENGTATGGRPGDQTGGEVRFRAPYLRDRGWTTICRPPAYAALPKTPLTSTTRPTIRRGDTGALVKTLQRGALDVFPSYAGPTIGAHGGADGSFGQATEAFVRDFQSRVSLPVTGVVDAATWAKLATFGV